MSSGASRMDWQHGGPPPPHRSGFSPYDSPPHYENHPSQGTAPYTGGYHGGPPGPQQHPTMGMAPPRGPPPPEYWSYDQPPQGPPRRLGGPPPPSGVWRGPPHDSPGAVYDHRMGPPPPLHQQQGYPPYPPAPHRHQYPTHAPSHPGPHHPPSYSMGLGRSHDGRPYMPDVQQQPPPSAMRGPSDLSLRGPPPVMRTPPRSNMKAPPFGSPVRSSASLAKKEEKESPGKGAKTDSKRAKGRGSVKKGDALTLLANVCKQDVVDETAPEAPATLAPVPTSPAQRTLRPSPVVTPASTPMGKPPLMPHPQISPVDHKAEGGYWAADPNPEHYSRRSREGGARSGSHPPSNRHTAAFAPPPSSAPGPPPASTPGGSYSEWQGGSPSPALVERGSFDSVEPPTPSDSHVPQTPYDSRRGPPPGPYYGGGPPIDYPPSGRGPPPPNMAQRKYPTPRWPSYPTPDPSVRPPYPPAQNDMGGHLEYAPHSHPHQSTPPPYGEPPHPHAPSRHQYPPIHSQHSYPPPPHYHHPPGPPPHYSNVPPTPILRHDGPPPPGPGPIAYAPYTYVQQPHLEEKTVLRKKFSWKHYPELERFLIANRDEYLKHSSMNYTAEQKQYNNWLTERLLEVAAEHHYAFDPEDFTFVSIRDRIRCYYKSYVQTARKRGVNLPNKPENGGPNKKPKLPGSSTYNDDDGDDAHDDEKRGNAKDVNVPSKDKEKKENGKKR